MCNYLIQVGLIRHFAVVLFCFGTGASLLIGQNSSHDDVNPDEARQREAHSWLSALTNSSFGSMDGGQLALVPDQTARIKELLRELYGPANGSAQPQGNLSENSSSTTYLDRVESLRLKINEGVLLPHQRQLLDQFWFQTEISMGGGNVVQALMSPRRGNPLGLTTQQAENLRQLEKEWIQKRKEIELRIEAAKKELEESSAQFKSAALDELNKEQVDLLNQMLEVNRADRKRATGSQ